jgi:predicted dehydrogenase
MSPDPTRPLRVGVAGTGMIGAVHVRSARLAGAEVVAVAASSPASAAAAAERLAVPRACADAAELAADDSIDVVHVCTPNSLHAPLALAAMRAGKDVICEKPLGVDLAEAEELAAVAAETGRILAVPFAYRFYASVREARARIAAGAAGDLRLIGGGYLQDWLADPEADNWRVDAVAGGRSRAFADIGSHWCDLVEFVTGLRIVRLTALTGSVVPTRGPAGATRAATTEDIALIQFETDAGVLGSAQISQVSLGMKNRLTFRVDGSAAGFAFDQENPDELRMARADGAVAVLPRDPALMSAAAAPYSLVPPGHPQGYLEAFELFTRDAYAAVTTRTVPDGLPTVTDGLRSARLVEAVLASAASGAAVDLRERD